MKRYYTSVLGALAALTLSTSPVHAKTTLRVADSLPPGNYIAENLIKVFMAEVEEGTQGEVSFDYFPAQQLGKAKDMLSLTQMGVADIGYVGPSYVSDKLPLSAVAQLPGVFDTSCEGTMAFWELAKSGGYLAENEFGPEKVRALMVLTLSPYQLLSSKPMSGLSDFKNIKIRVTGGAQELMVSKLQSTPVQMSAPDTREALARNTIDAIVFPYSSVPPYDLAPHLKSSTEGLNLGSFVGIYMISENKFNNLPESVQQALLEAGEKVTRSACEAVDKQTLGDAQKIKDGGVQFIRLSDEDKQTLDSMLQTVNQEWAADLDARGKPGTEVLQQYMQALENQRTQ